MQQQLVLDLGELKLISISPSVSVLQGQRLEDSREIIYANRTLVLSQTPKRCCTPCEAMHRSSHDG